MNELPNQARATRTVNDALITEELSRRPPRAPDYRLENRVLLTLAQELANHPRGILQKVAESVIELCHADSAVISVLAAGGEHGVFCWHAVAGQLEASLGATMPCDASLCETVLAPNSVLLFSEPQRFFPALRDITPPMYESMLVPWEVNGKIIGILWAVAHRPMKC